MQRISKTACATMVLGVGGLVLPATAAVYEVTTTDDTIAVTSLRGAILAANANPGPDVINLQDGVYMLTLAGAGEDAGLTGDLDITDDLTINGESQLGTVVDGNMIDRVFHVLGSYAVNMSDLAIVNGQIDDNGGGILSENGVVELHHVTIEACEATDCYDGGGIYNDDGAIALYQSEVCGNDALNGGGLYTRGIATLHESVVRDNDAAGDEKNCDKCDGCEEGDEVGDGGGIYLDWGLLTLEGSLITLNRAADYGGGIYALSGYLTMDQSQVTFNEAYDGGGVYLDEASMLATWCDFLNNEAVSSDGGGVYACETGALDFYDCQFLRNEASSDGGGIYTDYGNMVLTRCLFEDNYAGSDGGAYYSGYPYVIATECDFIGNASGSDGGAVYADDGGLEAYDCLFELNTSDGDGGAFYGSSATSIVTHCDFIENFATGTAGALYTGYRTEAWECNFIGNESESDAGALYSDYSLTIADCLFESNLTDGGGGAMDVGDYSVDITNTDFFGNRTVGGDGGAIQCGSGGSAINCRFRDNYADGDGGAVDNEEPFDFVDCEFTDNTALDDGGAIYNDETLSLTRCTFTGNATIGTGGYGGAIYHSDYGTLGVDCSFYENVSADGGAVYVNDGSVSFVSSTFANNLAGDTGGALSNDGGDLTCTNCTISGNTAFQGGGVYTGSGYQTVLLNCTVAFNSAEEQLPAQGPDGVASVKETPRKPVRGGAVIGQSQSDPPAGPPESDGGGVFNEGTTLLQNTILDSNTDENVAGSEPVISLGNNLDSDGSGDLSGPNDLSEVGANLGVLKDNGGPTHTHALLQGSNAIDAGNDTFAPWVDQRGEPRPQGPQSDIGAYEADGDEGGGVQFGCAADFCDEAGAICPGPPQLGSNVGATGDVLFCGSLFGGHDVWCTYTPATSGQAFLAIEGPPNLFVYAVYDGCPEDGGTLLDCNPTDHFEIVWDAEGGETYWFRISGQNFDQGEFYISLSGPDC